MSESFLRKDGQDFAALFAKTKAFLKGFFEHPVRGFRVSLSFVGDLFCKWCDQLTLESSVVVLVEASPVVVVV